MKTLSVLILVLYAVLQVSCVKMDEDDYFKALANFRKDFPIKQRPSDHYGRDQYEVDQYRYGIIHDDEAPIQSDYRKDPFLRGRCVWDHCAWPFKRCCPGTNKNEYVYCLAGKCLRIISKIVGKK